MSLVKSFNKEQRNHPEHSTLVSFLRAVAHKNPSNKEIIDWFDKLVDRRDYTPSQKEQILEYTKSIKQ